jgi:hypothetical protein
MEVFYASIHEDIKFIVLLLRLNEVCTYEVGGRLKMKCQFESSKAT